MVSYKEREVHVAREELVQHRKREEKEEVLGNLQFFSGH